MKAKIIAAVLALAATTEACGEKTGKMYHFETDGNGFNTRNFFYDTGEEVVVFDSQFTERYAAQSVEFIRSKTKSPIRYLVITHPNPDKFNAIPFFKTLGAQVVASRRTAGALKAVHEYKKYYWVNIAKAFTDETYPRLGTPDIVFDDSYDLKLADGKTVRLTELATPGVSTNQTIAFIPDVRALVVGDLVHYRAHAWLEGGIAAGKPRPDLRAWIATLGNVAAQFATEKGVRVYGGRGEDAPLADAVREQIAYLEKAAVLVENYIKQLGNRRAELSTDQAKKHYAALQALFQKEFPGYALDYMIGYGVYGLVNSKL